MASSKKEKKNWIPSPAQLPQHLFLSIFQAGLESHSVTDNINYCIQLMNWETATYSWCVHFIFLEAINLQATEREQTTLV